VERLSRDAVTTEDSHHVQQTAARRQQVVYMIRRTQSMGLAIDDDDVP